MFIFLIKYDTIYLSLIHICIIPFTFVNEKDYDDIDEMDKLKITGLLDIKENTPITVQNVTKGNTFQVEHNLTQLDIDTIKAGGTLNLIRQNQN